jgi:hypothetical protein
MRGSDRRRISPAYWSAHAVIFTSTRTSVDEGYGATADRMVELAQQQPGFLVAGMYELMREANPRKFPKLLC